MIYLNIAALLTGCTIQALFNIVLEYTLGSREEYNLSHSCLITGRISTNLYEFKKKVDKS